MAKKSALTKQTETAIMYTNTAKIQQKSLCDNRIDISPKKSEYVYTERENTKETNGGTYHERENNKTNRGNEKADNRR